MAPYTLPLNEAETQLRDLVTQMQTTHRPLVLTGVGTAKPVAVVLDIDAYERAQRQRQRLYHLQLTQMKEWLDRVEQRWDDSSIHAECIAVWQDGILLLWEVAPETMREFCAALILAVKELPSAKLSKEQVVALRYALGLLRDSDPDMQSLEKAHQMLIDSNIAPLLSFDDDSLVQHYVNEL